MTGQRPTHRTTNDWRKHSKGGTVKAATRNISTMHTNQSTLHGICHDRIGQDPTIELRQGQLHGRRSCGSKRSPRLSSSSGQCGEQRGRAQAADAKRDRVLAPLREQTNVVMCLECILVQRQRVLATKMRDGPTRNNPKQNQILHIPETNLLHRTNHSQANERAQFQDSVTF